MSDTGAKKSLKKIELSLTADVQNCTCGISTVFCRTTETPDPRQTSTIHLSVCSHRLDYVRNRRRQTHVRPTQYTGKTSHVQCQGCQRCNAHRDGNHLMMNCTCAPPHDGPAPCSKTLLNSVLGKNLEASRRSLHVAPITRSGDAKLPDPPLQVG